MASLCLVMIVKDEEDTIERCIDSVAKYIDHWVIVDTGSKDDTIAKIHEVMAKHNIPGTLYERPWVNFGHNRTESLTLAQGICDYRFVMDADDTFESFVDNPFEGMDTTKDSYHLHLELAGIRYTRSMLMRSDQEWEYVGVLHEYPYPKSKVAPSTGYVEGCLVHAQISPLKRAKSVKDKYAHDAKVLEKALKDEPENNRYVFYLAQSYFDSQQYKKAKLNYLKRSKMKGWEEEVYISLYRAALCSLMLDEDYDATLKRFSLAWENRPFRLEAAYQIVKMLRQDGRYVMAFTYANMAMQNFLNYPHKDTLFYDVNVHEWMFLDEYCMAAYYVGQKELAKVNMDQFFATDMYLKVPDHEKQRLKKNYEFYSDASKNQLHNPDDVDVEQASADAGAV